MSKFLVTYKNHRLINGSNQIEVDIKFNKETRIANIEYGFDSHYVKCKVDSERYKIHKSIIPGQVIQMVHIKSGRVFTCGKTTGFVVYQTPLLENGIPVATLKWETYYKD